MAETAFNGLEASQFHSPSGVQDYGKVVFDNPLVIDFTAGTVIEPRPSNGNRSNSSSRRAGALAMGALAAVIAAEGFASAQGPSASPFASPEPSQDPLTALNCPSPEPSTSPSPSPTPDTIAVVQPMKYSASMSDGRRGTLFEDQTDPSAAPTFVIESPAPSASPDPLTAGLIPCGPDGSPLPSADPSKEATPAKLPIEKAVKKIANEKIKNVEDNTKEEFEAKVLAYWDKYQAILSTYAGNGLGGDSRLTKEYLELYLENINKGIKDVRDEGPASIRDSRLRQAAGLAYMLLEIYEWSGDIKLVHDSLKLADVTFDYGVLGINPPEYDPHGNNLWDMAHELENTASFYVQ